VSVFELRSIGIVESSLTDAGTAPRQPDEGAPEAWLKFDPQVRDALQGLRAGDRIILITWLDRAHRDVLSVHPRGDETRRRQGVFSTRSPHRPNPIGLHEIEVAEVSGDRMRVRQLEALNGTPIIDVKPVLAEAVADR